MPGSIPESRSGHAAVDPAASVPVTTWSKKPAVATRMFVLSAHDNGLYFFHGRNDVERCPICHELVDKWGEELASVVVPHLPRYDVSFSYDGVLVATHRFRRSVEEAGIAGLAFRPLQRELFAVRPRVAVPFDAVRRGTRLTGRCESCQRYESVIGATPPLLMPGATAPPMGFVRTDLEFGSADEKTPLVLCGDEAARALRAVVLRGLDLRPVLTPEGGGALP